MDGEKGIKAFAESLGADYPILADASKETGRAYGVIHDQRNVPERWTFFIGKDGKISHIQTKVATGSHGAEIAAKLKELGVAEKK
jgi:peroxiredoxin Q/BCP